MIKEEALVSFDSTFVTAVLKIGSVTIGSALGKAWLFTPRTIAFPFEMYHFGIII